MFRLGEVGLVPSCLFPPSVFLICAVQDVSMTVGPSSRVRKSDSFRGFVTKRRSGNNAPKIASDEILCLCGTISVIYGAYLAVT
jgi:hypothetical protein